VVIGSPLAATPAIAPAADTGAAALRPSVALASPLAPLPLSVPGSWFLVPGSWFPVPGSWFPVLGSRFPVPGSRFSVLGSWFSVLGSWFSVPGSRFSVLGSRFSVLGSPLPRRHIIAAEERLTIERRLAFGRAGAHI